MKTINKGLVLCGVLAALFGAACGGGVDDVATPENAPATTQEPGKAAEPGEAQALLSECLSWGYYSCPSDGMTFDYAPPKCGELTKPQAQTACESYCTVTCKDSGWKTY